MKYFIDAEFIDDGVTIDLISIGIAAEDGREYYAQSMEFTWDAASDWVQENVYSHLDYCSHRDNIAHGGSLGAIHLSKVYHQTAHGILGKCKIVNCPWRNREQLRSEISAFIDPSHGKPEFWAWCGAYDFVVLCQLFGTMMDAPEHWPHHIKDLQYLLDERGISDDQLPQQEETAHNALADARHIKRLWEWLAKRK